MGNSNISEAMVNKVMIDFLLGKISKEEFDKRICIIFSEAVEEELAMKIMNYNNLKEGSDELKYGDSNVGKSVI